MPYRSSVQFMELLVGVSHDVGSEVGTSKTGSVEAGERTRTEGSIRVISCPTRWRLRSDLQIQKSNRETSQEGHSYSKNTQLLTPGCAEVGAFRDIPRASVLLRDTASKMHWGQKKQHYQAKH